MRPPQANTPCQNHCSARYGFVLFLGRDQRWHVRGTARVQSVCDRLLTHALPILNECVRAKRASSPTGAEEMVQQCRLPDDASASYGERRRVRRKSEAPELTVDNWPPGAIIDRSRPDFDSVTLSPTLGGGEIEKWFHDAFEAMQQATCREVAMIWIKTVHPTKQSTHPYTGKSSLSDQPNPEATKPPYWPTDVSHRLPHRIPKPGKAG